MLNRCIKRFETKAGDKALYDGLRPLEKGTLKMGDTARSEGMLARKIRRLKGAGRSTEKTAVVLLERAGKFFWKIVKRAH